MKQFDLYTRFLENLKFDQTENLKKLFELNCKEDKDSTTNTVVTLKSTNLPKNSNVALLEKTINTTAAFRNYQIFPKNNTIDKPFVLTGVTVRPSTLFLRALFGEDLITLPGSGKLFAFTKPHEEIAQLIDQQDPEKIISFSAKGHKGKVVTNGKTYEIDDLSSVYGEASYKISIKEIQATQKSQRIYTTPMLPLLFYTKLKEAMAKDHIVIVPGNDSVPRLLNELEKDKLYPELQKLLNEVNSTPSSFGFTSKEKWEEFKKLTLYQIGSMVVKTEQFRVFIDQDGQIIAREPNREDAILLINACGIRGFSADKTVKEQNLPIMRDTFKTSLLSAGDGIIICPAVGMGVWRGDPETYWTAFLDAVVVSGKNLECIFVNPNHQNTKTGKYVNENGGEFQKILDHYLEKATKDGNLQHLANLKKIVNLRESKQDIVQLAKNLKQAFPEKTVAILNASDPDVTLGNHVGEYTNNVPHTITTEENYTAMGTNGLCFEGITGIHKDPARLLQVNVDDTVTSLDRIDKKSF